MALRILYVGHRNSIGELSEDGFTQDNEVGNPQKESNPLVVDSPKGILGGSVAAAVESGVIGPATGPDDSVVGLFINDAAGNLFESTTAASSGVAPYVDSFGTFESNLYETTDTSGNPIPLPQVGDKLYASQNGLLTTAAGLPGGTIPAGATVVGVVTKAPTSTDIFMRFALRL
jgi:hypothetical protein